MLRTFIPIKKCIEKSEEETLILKKEAKKVSAMLLDIFEECFQERISQTTSNGKTPLLKKREIEELEAENLNLKQRLLTLASMNKELLKRVKTQQDE